jgi:hypothetical protein
MRAGFSQRRVTLVVAAVLYVVGVWLHFPHGGGHIYSDIPSVFQSRECLETCNIIPVIPYVNGFIEYPVLVSFFIYAMGLVGLAIPVSIQTGYYLASVAVLAVPSILLVDETMKIAGLVGADQRRVMKYLVVTPTFLFLLLVNWYAIGVYLMLLALRMFLQGRGALSGVLFGLSAASNMVTAAPAMGLLFGIRSVREAVKFAGSALVAFAAVNAPFVATNPKIWVSYWQYESNWYIEGSWMRLFLSLVSPLRHTVFFVSAAVLLGAILILSYRRPAEPLTLAWLSAFAVLFSSYIFTPQMNLMILPFLVLAPVVARYWEFLAFDVLSAAIIVVGLSQPLQIVGITYGLGNPNSGSSLVVWAGILRSLWLGKLLLWNGIRGTFFPKRAAPVAAGSAPLRAKRLGDSLRSRRGDRNKASKASRGSRRPKPSQG